MFKTSRLRNFKSSPSLQYYVALSCSLFFVTSSSRKLINQSILTIELVLFACRGSTAEEAPHSHRRYVAGNTIVNTQSLYLRT